MLSALLAVFLAGCPAPPTSCACPGGIEGHGALRGEECLCLPSLPPTPDPDPAEVFWVDADAGGSGTRADPWAVPDWAILDRALAHGPVEVRFDASDRWPEHLAILRTDAGPHRLVLRGRGWVREPEGWERAAGRRAVVPGVRTPFEDTPRHRITVRGFEITGSRDKGVYWRAGDEVLIEDNVIHANRGTPALSLEYSSRTGLPSSGFTVRNNHVYDQVGECIYLGGSEGRDEPSHTRVVVENNLVHDCRHPFSSQHDGINVKDRIGEAVVRRNVVLRADWGLEVASPGTYVHNLVVDTDREGIQVDDGFGPVRDMVFADDAVVGAGHDGWHLAPSTGAAEGIVVERLTVLGADRAGVLVGGERRAEVSFDDLALVGTEVAFDGWGRPEGLVVGDCATGPGEVAGGVFEGRVDCARIDPPSPEPLAGPDGVLFTADDGWRIEGWGARLPGLTDRSNVGWRGASGPG